MERFDKSGALSREFLINRGWCCGNACKNCPYFPSNTKGSSEVLAETILKNIKNKYMWSIDGETWLEPDPQKEFEHQTIIGEIYYKTIKD